MKEISLQTIKVNDKFRTMVMETMCNFDFGKVHSLMTIMGWRWQGAIPDESQIRDTAEGLLFELSDPSCIESSTGGFLADWEDIEGVSYMRLRFIFEESSSDQVR